MPIFSANDLRARADSYGTLQRRLDAIATAYALLPYKTQLGKEYATHGLLRRFSAMHHSIERVFGLLPPETGSLPIKRS